VLIRTGKALDHKTTEINIVFKDRTKRNVVPNLLTIRVQPDEGIAIALQAKKPGFDNELQPVKMEFNYQTSFDGIQPDAYERVLIDAIVGDQSLFATSAEVLKCWEILEPVLADWQSNTSELHFYPKGSRGPIAADELAKEYGSDWITNPPVQE
jgi:glucose-6-phosphate 1-dehydrogenase